MTKANSYKKKIALMLISCVVVGLGVGFLLNHFDTLPTYHVEDQGERRRNAIQNAYLPVIEQGMNEVYNCFKINEQRSKIKFGKVAMSWNILPSGEVTDVEIVSSGFPEEYKVNGCVKGVVKEWEFNNLNQGIPISLHYTFSWSEKLSLRLNKELNMEEEL